MQSPESATPRASHPLALLRILIAPSVSFGSSGGRRCPEEVDVELGIGRELLGMALLLVALLGVMWLLAATRRSPH
jgi:hypothetical protein